MRACMAVGILARMAVGIQVCMARRMARHGGLQGAGGHTGLQGGGHSGLQGSQIGSQGWQQSSHERLQPVQSSAETPKKSNEANIPSCFLIH